MPSYHHSPAARGLEAVRNTSNGTDSLERVATQLNITTALSIVITTNTTLGRTYECALGLPSVVETRGGYLPDPREIAEARRYVSAPMIETVLLLAAAVTDLFRRRWSLLAETALLRHQLIMITDEPPERSLFPADRRSSQHGWPRATPRPLAPYSLDLDPHLRRVGHAACIGAFSHRSRRRHCTGNEHFAITPRGAAYSPSASRGPV